MSLGSLSDPSANGVSFSYDLSWFGKLVVILLEVYGKTRSMPSRADYSMSFVEVPDDDKDFTTKDGISRKWKEAQTMALSARTVGEESSKSPSAGVPHAPLSV